MMLNDIRVVDLTDGGAQMAGYLFAQLGADVVLVEPPGGAALRRRDTWWRAYGRGKRSIVLDLATAEGRARLEGLIRGADVVLREGEGPNGIPLTDAEVTSLNPDAVRVHITPFGVEGPKSALPATDLTVVAASGQMAISGEEQRAPLRIPAAQAIINAAAEGVMGALVALHGRRNGLPGQKVDASAQEAMLAATQSMCLSEAANATVTRRCGDGAIVPPMRVRMRFPAADGWVSITHAFGDSMGPFTNRLMEWIAEEGECPADLAGEDWVAFGLKLKENPEVLADFERSKSVIAEFTSRRTRAELFREALERRVLIAPVYELGDVLELEQLESRDFWDRDAEGNRLPGPFVRGGGTPLRRGLTCPELGEHTGGPDWVAEREQRDGTPAEPRRAPAGDGPLADVRVLDLTWAVAGPSIGRALADYGATVVRVESAGRMDLLRGSGPFVDDVIGAERSAQYQNVNAGKLGITLDLSNEAALQIVHRLVEWADVVSESFSPGVLDRLGLGWDRLREINPRIVLLSSSLMGQTGPLAHFAGLGNLSTAMSGFASITGWPDGPPTAPFGAYLDYLSPRLGQLALLAAVHDARRTGRGQHLDLSQMEVAMHFLAPALLERQLTGVEPERLGNADPDMVPHGVYACRGQAEAVARDEDDAPCWVAIACRDDDDWRRLCRVVGSGLDPDLRFERRLARRQQIDEALAGWCAQREAAEAARQLLDYGVPAHRVQNSRQLLDDEHLRARGHWVVLPHPEVGRITIEGPRAHLSETPGRPRTCAPFLGQHVVEVVTGLAGFTEDEFAELVARGALGE